MKKNIRANYISLNLVHTILKPNDYPPLDSITMKAFSDTLPLLAERLGCEFVNYCQKYLDTPVLTRRGKPIAMFSEWLNMPAMYGTDLMLVAKSVTNSIVPDFEYAAQVYTKMYGLYTISTAYLPGQTFDGKALMFKAHYADLTKTLGDLNTKQRNEVRKGFEQHQNKITLVEQDIPHELLPSIYAYWSEHDSVANACYQTLLWSWCKIAASTGKCIIVNSYNTSGQWCFSVALMDAGDYFQFTAYSQHPERRERCSGTFMLATTFELLREMGHTKPVILTCPAFIIEDGYEAYKKQLSHGTISIPSFFSTREYIAENSTPPLYEAGMEKWITQ